MLTNPRDAFRGQSRSPSVVPFDALGMVSYQCAIVTSSLRRAVSQIFDFKKSFKSGSEIIKVIGTDTYRSAT